MTDKPSHPKTTEAIAQEFASITGYLQAVSETLEQGHMPDMKGLDARITRLCEQILAADRDVQERFIEKLNELLKNINACETQLRTCGKTLGKEDN